MFDSKSFLATHFSTSPLAFFSCSSFSLIWLSALCELIEAVIGSCPQVCWAHTAVCQCVYIQVRCNSQNMHARQVVAPVTWTATCKGMPFLHNRTCLGLVWLANFKLTVLEACDLIRESHSFLTYLLLDRWDRSVEVCSENAPRLSASLSVNHRRVCWIRVKTDPSRAGFSKAFMLSTALLV